MPSDDLLRQLPSVDKLLNHPDSVQLIDQYGREAVRDAMRQTLADVRQRILNEGRPGTSITALMERITAHLASAFQPTLRPVINATGVIIHTNLGRALLSDAAQKAVQAMAAHYNTLEFDLDTGKRGSRYTHAEQMLCDVTGAEAALVVNNNAAALILILATFAQGRGVILSRGQLVEIGGGFRIPDIMRQSGAQLVEVGTTNRTRASDYEQAIRNEATATDYATRLIMRIHSSNFKQIGFVQQPTLEELAAISHAHDLYCVDDLGSGALLDTAAYGLAHEPMVQESIAVGADLVAFSGDKLLGGPQAGLIVGKRDLIQRLKKHPLARALRADKLCYAALQATLDHYRKGDAVKHIPVWRMIARTLDDLQQTAERWQQTIGLGEVISGESTVGGGSLPGDTLPTALLALEVHSAEAMMARLRAANPPIIARIMNDRILLDPRTVLPHQDDELLHTVRDLLA